MVFIGIGSNHLEITGWILSQGISTEENLVPHIENYLEMKGC